MEPSQLFPRAKLYAPPKGIGQNIPRVRENYCGAASRSWTYVLNDDGVLGLISRASLHKAAANFQHWPLKLAHHSQKGIMPLCPLIMSRKMANILTANLHPASGPEIWSETRYPPHFHLESPSSRTRMAARGKPSPPPSPRSSSRS